MHARRLRASVLALLVLLVTGCGGGSDRAAREHDASAPRASVPLTVAPTDGRVGDATAATPGGLRRLARGGRPPDGDKSRPRRHREGVGAGAACPDVGLLPVAETLAAVRAATMCLVNGERADAGLPPLQSNARLDRAAEAHSQDMVARQYFAHVSPEGGDIVDRTRAAGYISSGAPWVVGENLAWGTGELATPRGIVAAWMSSGGHRANILRDRYEEAGLAVVLGNPRRSDGAGGTYTMTFGATEGSRQLVVSKPAAAKKSTSRRGKASRKRAKRAARRAAARRAAAAQRAVARRRS